MHAVGQGVWSTHGISEGMPRKKRRNEGGENSRTNVTPRCDVDVDVPCERQQRRLYTRTDTRNGEECMGGRRSHGRSRMFGVRGPAAAVKRGRREGEYFVAGHSVRE